MKPKVLYSSFTQKWFVTYLSVWLNGLKRDIIAREFDDWCEAVVWAGQHHTVESSFMCTARFPWACPHFRNLSAADQVLYSQYKLFSIKL